MQNKSDTADILEDYSITVRLGELNVRHDKHFRYALPSASGKAYELIQGFHGSFSHNREESFYALDFKMPKGDTVCAARDGLVVWSEDHHEEGGKDPSFYNKANSVIIMHKDGTMALYNHLQKNGGLVEIGQTVKQGQPLGLSGNSGYTTTPHLHFAIHENNKSVPIRFKNLPKTLKKNHTYKIRN
ncbi:MAG: M23 family metallopeptidase [Cyclobacteriaceae bacterium]